MRGHARREGVPFTPAHVAAVLPLTGRRGRAWLDPTALVLGSMAPDFDYFLHGHMRGSIAHTAVGLWMFDLPVTLVLYALYLGVLERPLRATLPKFISGRLPTSPRATNGSAPLLGPHPGTTGGPRARRRAARIVAGARVAAGGLVGAATHLCWDSFTHYYGLTVRHFPWLRTKWDPTYLPGVEPLPLYRVLQHASTMLGLLFIALWCIARLSRRPCRSVERFRRRSFAAILPVACTAGATVGLWIGIGIHGSPCAGNLADLVVASIDGALVLGLAASSALALHLASCGPAP
jgi:hypothetical protein